MEGSTANLSSRIRDCIGKSSKGLDVESIAKKLGTDKARVRNACFNMARTGVLLKSGDGHRQRFAIGRPLDDIKGRRYTTKEEREAARLIARREVEARRSERIRKSKQKRAKRQRAKFVPTPKMMVSLPKSEPLPPIKRVETVAEWILRTGRGPEVLPVGASAEPLGITPDYYRRAVA